MEKLVGGKADGKKQSDFDPKQLKLGKKVEREHSKDPDVRCEIAKDHLEEIPDYYTRLDKMESKAKRQGASKSMGEGSRGGTVIGHTRSGKPIYQHGSHEMKLNPEEHHDAMRAHEGAARFHEAGAKLADEDDSLPDDMRQRFAKEHIEAALYHKERAKRQESKAGVSKSMEVDGEVASIAVISGSKILMGVRRDCGRWTLPGGHIEPGESSLDGAIRELREETGIYAQSLIYLGSEMTTTFTGKRYLIHSYAMTAEPETTTLDDPDREVFGWTWVDTSRGLPEIVSDNLHSPKNLTLRLLGLQKSEFFVSDLVKATEGQMMPGHKYIRRYKSHTNEWVYVYHENDAPKHVLNETAMGHIKQLSELGHEESKKLIASIQDYHDQHLARLRQLADLGHEGANKHLRIMGVDRHAEKQREEMERTERKAREAEALVNPFTKDLSPEDHAKALEAIRMGVKVAIFDHLAGYASTDLAKKLTDNGITLATVTNGLSEKKSIKGLLELLHQNLKPIDSAHRGLTSQNSSANSAGGYGNLGYNTAVKNLSDKGLIPHQHDHRRSHDGHTVPVDDWKRKWEGEAADRARRAEEERTRAAREAEAAERRRAGVVAFHGTLAHHIMTLMGRSDDRMDMDQLVKADEMLTKFYGRKATKADWPYDFSDKGIKVRVTNASFGSGSARFSFEASKDGQRITDDWSRDWSVGADGHPEIYNALLIVNSEFRGTGVNLGSMVNSAQIKMMKAIDPNKAAIKVTAALGVGGYNWANQPFSFQSDSQRRSLVDSFARTLETESGVRLTEAQKALFKYPCHIAAFDDGKTYVKTVSDSLSLSDKQRETNSIICVPGQHPLTSDERSSGKTRRVSCHIGKYFLLGHSWSGIAEMKNMKEDHAPYRYFQTYAALKRRSYTTLDQPYVAVVESAKEKTSGRAAGAPPPVTSPPASAPVARPAGESFESIDFGSAPRYAGSALRRYLQSRTVNGKIRMSANRWIRMQAWDVRDVEWFVANARPYLTRDARQRANTILTEARARGPR